MLLHYCKRLLQGLLCQVLLPELFFAEGIFLYDIESEPDLCHDFLHGFIKLKRSIDNQYDIESARYQPFLNIDNHSENDFQKFVLTVCGRGRESARNHILVSNFFAIRFDPFTVYIKIFFV